MERLICGTETQFALHREPNFSSNRQVGDVSSRLVRANNRNYKYGIPGYPEESDKHEHIRSKIWLKSGGLLYYDAPVYHAEYATPETRNLGEMPACEQAGAVIANDLLSSIQIPWKVYRNNTDYSISLEDHSNGEVFTTFAYHENYSTKEVTNEVIQRLLPFLVTRQIFTGSGCFIKKELRDIFKNSYSISQRSLAVNIQGLFIKIGYHSHFCDSSRHQTNVLHITCGETNRSSFVTKLKIGATALVLQMLEDGWEPPDFDFSSADIVNSARSIATDETFKWIFTCGWKDMPAIEVQRIYLLEAFKRFFGRDQDSNWVLRNWAAVLNQLEQDPMKTNILDWVAKKTMLDRLAVKGSTEKELIRADLGYHAVDPKLDLAAVLKVPLPSAQEVEHAVYYPPKDTRAAGRGILVSAIAKAILYGWKVKPRLSWDYFMMDDQYVLSMSDPFSTYIDNAIKIAASIESFSAFGKELRY